MHIGLVDILYIRFCNLPYSIATDDSCTTLQQLVQTSLDSHKISSIKAFVNRTHKFPF